MPESLTLYAIETALLDLLQQRDSVESDTTYSTYERTEAIDIIDTQIQEYVRAEISKVDGVAAYIRECQARADNLDAEANRIRERSKAWASKGKRLEGMVLSIMQQTDKMRLDGCNSTFQRRTNPPSVEIAQPDLLPDEYIRKTITLAPDKVRIGRALKMGDPVPGCRLNHSERLEIK